MKKENKMLFKIIFKDRDKKVTFNPIFIMGEMRIMKLTQNIMVDHMNGM